MCPYCSQPVHIARGTFFGNITRCRCVCDSWTCCSATFGATKTCFSAVKANGEYLSDCQVGNSERCDLLHQDSVIWTAQKIDSSAVLFGWRTLLDVHIAYWESHKLSIPYVISLTHLLLVWYTRIKDDSRPHWCMRKHAIEAMHSKRHAYSIVRTHKCIHAGLCIHIRYCAYPHMYACIS